MNHTVIIILQHKTPSLFLDTLTKKDMHQLLQHRNGYGDWLLNSENEAMDVFVKKFDKDIYLA